MVSGLILIACGFVGLAIAVNLLTRPAGEALPRPWLTRGLFRGDLSALAELARGPALDAGYDQLERLKDRGFVKRKLSGSFRMTLKGYFALVVRVLSRPDRPLRNRAG